MDGRRRAGIRITIIVAPGVGMLCWAHYAPSLNDSVRKTYRQLLRWNDELPFVKFALSEGERIILTAEVPEAGLDRDALGRTLARLVAVSDLLYPESTAFLGEPAAGRREADGTIVPAPTPTPTRLLERYRADLAELLDARPSAASGPGDAGDARGDTAEARGDTAEAHRATSQATARAHEKPA